MLKDGGRVEGFEGSVGRMVEDDPDRLPLAQTQAAPALYEMLAPDRLTLLTEIIDITEHFQ